MSTYAVTKLPPRSDIRVRVPASKSILSRALLLAALSRGTVRILTGTFGEDTRDMLSCLAALGILIVEGEGELTVHGCGGHFPVTNAKLNVGSAGTAARFLTVALAFCGGTYEITASEQMQKRPMGVLGALEQAGISIEYLGERGHFPFVLTSNGFAGNSLTLETGESTQYASGVLLAAGALGRNFTLKLTGPRTYGSYLAITLRMLTAFGVPYVRSGNEIAVSPAGEPPASFAVEPDVSSACYFYALSLLCGARVLVEGVHLNTAQGDIKFLGLLGQKGVRIRDTEDGVVADGRNIPSFNGFDEDLSDFSDQTMTVAALAAFATMPSILRNIAHIRRQECDRIEATVQNLLALGVRAFTSGEEIFIEPEPVHGACIKTYGDHRVAMAFALVGLKIGGVTIDDAGCCAKTFPGFFGILDKLTGK